MAHMMKHTKASCGHMFAHYDRRAEHISNESVDRTRTHLNYNLATHQQMEQGEFVRQRCGEVRCQNRKDVNVMVSWVVTAPKDLPETEHKAFFKSTYEFLKNRYGEKNIVSAYVHNDENQPHMHFAFVPVVYDEKNQREKVSAKEAVSRSDLQSFHTDLQKHLERDLGHEVNVLNEATKDGNKTVAELKLKTAAEKVQAAEAKAAKAENKAAQLESRLEFSKDGSVAVPQLADKAKLQSQNEALRYHIKKLESDNDRLKEKVAELEQKEQKRAERINDRSSAERKAADSADKLQMLTAYRSKHPEADTALIGYDKAVKAAEEYGARLLSHKQGVIQCAEAAKKAAKNAEMLTERKEALAAKNADIGDLSGKYEAAGRRLAELEQERAACGTLQIRRKLDLDSQIKALKEEQEQSRAALAEHGIDISDTAAVSDAYIERQRELDELDRRIATNRRIAADMTQESRQHLINYHALNQCRNSLTAAADRIVGRYDGEYTPPNEYAARINYAPNLTTAAEVEQAKALTMEQWQGLIDKSRAAKPTNERSISKSRSKGDDFELSR